MVRALRYDGILPTAFDANGAGGRTARQANQHELLEIRAAVGAALPKGSTFDIVVEGETPADDKTGAAAQVRGWAEAGATWWLESRWIAPDRAGVIERIRVGPPRIG